jgi:ribosomal protein S18 acetylase RimI-like enzyme
MGVRIETVRAVTDDLVAAVGRLLPQLSRAAPPGRERLAEIVGSPANTLLVARDGDTIVGMLMLVTFPLPTGLRARIEDVVVDRAARGRGVGAALSRAALDLAAERGAATVDLTSRPSRAAANRLYERLGFERRDSRMYRFRVTAPATEPEAEPAVKPEAAPEAGPVATPHPAPGTGPADRGGEGT